MPDWHSRRWGRHQIHIHVIGLILVASFFLMAPASHAARSAECHPQFPPFGDPSKPQMMRVPGPTMPYVVGCQLSDVERAFAQTGITVVPRERPSALPRAQITGQEPGPGSPLQPRSLIILYVSTGPATNNGAVAPVNPATPQKSSDPSLVDEILGDLAKSLTPQQPGTGPQVPPSPTSSADVNVTISLDLSGEIRAGTEVTYTLVIANSGPDTARDITVVYRLANLRLLSAKNDCRGETCQIAALSVDANATIFIHATVIEDGRFGISVNASHRGNDANLRNNSVDRFDGTSTVAGKTQPSPPATKAKIKIVTPAPHAHLATDYNGYIPGRFAAERAFVKKHFRLLVGLAIVLLAVVVLVAIHYRRRRWWKARLAAHVTLDLAGPSSTSTPISASAPPFSIQLQMVLGSAGPESKVPIIKEGHYFE